MKLILLQFNKPSHWGMAYDYIELLAKGMVESLLISAMTFRNLMEKIKLTWLNSTHTDSYFKVIELC
jgi:hypothetical protein